MMYANVIRMSKTRAATSILSVRVSPDERELLDAAAAQTRTSISDFVRRAAIEAAEMEILNRSNVTIPAKSGSFRGLGGAAGRRYSRARRVVSS